MIIHSKVLSTYFNENLPLDLVLNATRQKITEVEKVTIYHNDLLVIGKVLTVLDHPNSDHLHLLTVNVGKEVLNIVCGAKNVEANQYVIVAKENCQLPGGVIKKSKIRGEESCGMVCSLSEIGFDDLYIDDEYKDGIYYFKTKVTIGKPAFEELGLEGYSLDIKPSSNRSDLLSIYGYCKDLSAAINKKVYFPDKKPDKTIKPSNLNVTIESSTCIKYCATYFDSCVIQESPWWLKGILIASQIRPINNIVDISNYVMLLFGTPNHMFDYDKFGSDTILVRNALKNETVITLDNKVRHLIESDCLITNGTTPMAIAGVMGLLNSMIDSSTKNVILEVALFDSSKVAKTSSRLNLVSESSNRFSKGIEVERIELGLSEATRLLVELASATPKKEVIALNELPQESFEISLSLNEAKQFLSIPIDNVELEKILLNLGYGVTDLQNHSYLVVPPVFRKDVTNKFDVYEEISRIYGYDKVVNEPLIAEPMPGFTHRQKRIRDIKQFLASNGLFEVINYGLWTEEQVKEFPLFGDLVSVLKPINDERTTLRQDLSFGLISNYDYNENRQQTDINLFEIGKVYDRNQEITQLGILLSGESNKNYLGKGSKIDFYYLKGLVDSLFSKYNITFNYTNSNLSFLHPFIQATIEYNNTNIGYLGKYINNGHNLFIFNVNLDVLINVETNVVYNPISKFPVVYRDLSFLVDVNVGGSKILEVVKTASRKYLNSLNIFDVYQGDNIDPNEKSIAIRVGLSSNDTLKTEEVDSIIKKIVKLLEIELKIKLRDK